MDTDKELILCKLYLLMHKAEEVDPELTEETEPAKIKTELQDKILGTIDTFEKALNDELVKEETIQEFLKGYQRLSLLSKSYSNEEVESLEEIAKEVNIYKGFGIEPIEDGDRLNKVIFIDSVAHNLHQYKNNNGYALYKQLDELADISKSAGEQYREDRLLILDNPANVSKLEGLSKMDIIQKGNLLDKSKSFWRLFEKAIKEGVERLSDKELVALREWLFSKV
jgi:hypothetical protein